MKKALVIISTDYSNPGLDGIKNACSEVALAESLEIWTNPWTIGPNAISYHERLVKFCKLRNIHHIYVWQLVDLTRCSISNLLDLLVVLLQERIHLHIVDVFSDAPAQQILASLRVWELQCKSIAQKASIARQQAEGKVVGRPPKVMDINVLTRLAAEGKSTRDIAEITGISHTTVIRRLAAGKPTVVPQTDGVDV